MSQNETYRPPNGFGFVETTLKEYSQYMGKLKINSRVVQRASFVGVPILLSLLFFQNCQPGFQALDSHSFLSASSSSLEFTNSSNADDRSQLCHRWVNGNDQNGVPTWGPPIGNCDNKSLPLLFSVTHENECNTHMPCKGYSYDLNYKDNILAYMADYDPKDIGQWIKYSAVGNSTANQIEFALDTINYANNKSPTGRPVSNGYIFFGMANLEFNGKVNLNEELWVEFEYNVAASETGDPIKAGNRLMLAAALNWDEPGRANKAHYFEVNLYKTKDYHKAHFDINQCTKDANYDHCYYDSNGKWAEGKYISAAMAFGEPGPTVPDGQWRKVRIDLFKLAKKFQWFHPPSDWSQAKTDGLYIGLESKDLSRIYAKIRNLRIWKGSTPPSPSETPIAVNGGWSSWNDQGSCSKSCGGGLITQFRTCTNPAPANGGASCTGASTQQVACNTMACPTNQGPLPVNGGWSAWKDQGSCSKSCGGGLITQIRTCTNPAPANGGASCSGASSQQVACNTMACPTNSNNNISTINSTTHPIGLFRDGYSGFKSNGVSYCVFNSGSDMIASGYSQADYDSARQITQSKITLPFAGACSDTTRMGILRQGSAGLIRHQNGFCVLASGEHLQKCGYRQQDYDTAPQGNIGDLANLPLCPCE
ncbi:MAG: thrombospondin type-1 domain-containing protein [Bdellovibrio sp.]|nr:thrombospondin type-1 domain-containing protein [Bdellovibrio sp.]